jgi:hypothetical protein
VYDSRAGPVAAGQGPLEQATEDELFEQWCGDDGEGAEGAPPTDAADEPFAPLGVLSVVEQWPLLSERVLPNDLVVANGEEVTAEDVDAFPVGTRAGQSPL